MIRKLLIEQSHGIYYVGGRGSGYQGMTLERALANACFGAPADTVRKAAELLESLPWTESGGQFHEGIVSG